MEFSASCGFEITLPRDVFPCLYVEDSSIGQMQDEEFWRKGLLFLIFFLRSSSYELDELNELIYSNFSLFHVIFNFFLFSLSFYSVLCHYQKCIWKENEWHPSYYLYTMDLTFLTDLEYRRQDPETSVPLEDLTACLSIDWLVLSFTGQS